jgi:hypothetical protein
VHPSFIHQTNSQGERMDGIQRRHRARVGKDVLSEGSSPTPFSNLVGYWCSRICKLAHFSSVALNSTNLCHTRSTRAICHSV